MQDAAQLLQQVVQSSEGDDRDHSGTRPARGADKVVSLFAASDGAAEAARPEEPLSEEDWSATIERVRRVVVQVKHSDDRAKEFARSAQACIQQAARTVAAAEVRAEHAEAAAQACDERTRQAEARAGEAEEASRVLEAAMREADARAEAGEAEVRRLVEELESTRARLEAATRTAEERAQAAQAEAAQADRRIQALEADCRAAQARAVSAETWARRLRSTVEEELWTAATTAQS